MQYTTTLPLQSGGRVTIPEAIRNKLKVRDGDLVVVTVSTPEEMLIAMTGKERIDG